MEDKQNIMFEVNQSGQLNAVDEMVDTLLTMNISTGELRQVTQRAGQLGNCSGWSRALFTASSAYLVFQFYQVKKWRIDNILYSLFSQPPVSHWILFVTAALEALVWPMMFLLQPVERKSFSLRTTFILLLLLPGMSGFWGGFSFDAFAHFGVVPLMLVMSILGPARIARLVCVGPIMIRFLFGRNPCKALRHDGRPDVPVDSPMHEEAGGGSHDPDVQWNADSISF